MKKGPRPRIMRWATAVAVTMLGALVIYIQTTRRLIYFFGRLSAPTESLILRRATSPKFKHRYGQSTQDMAMRVLYIYVPVARPGANILSADRRQVERFALDAWNHLVKQDKVVAMALSISVVALGEDAGTCLHSSAWSSNFRDSIVCLPMPSQCRHPHYDIPTMGCILRTMRAHAPQEALVMFANGDLIFGLDLFEAILSLTQGSVNRQNHSDFVVVGTRREIKVPGRLGQYTTGSSIRQQIESLRRHARQDGVTFSKFGMDYFIFSSGDVIPVDFPEFLLGRWRWDNALMAHYLLNDILTVDASNTILAVHLGITPNETNALYASHTGWGYNDALVRAQYGEYFYLGHTESAHFAQTKSGGTYHLYERDRKASDTALVAIDYNFYDSTQKGYVGDKSHRSISGSIISQDNNQDYRVIDDTLHVLLAVSNPCNDRRRHSLMTEALLRLEKTPRVIVYVVEVAFEGNQGLRITSPENPRHLWLHEHSTPTIPLWYKENLLNLGVEQLLPRDWNAVAWVDGDIEWDSPSWAHDAITLLAGSRDVVQLFSHAVFMDEKGNTDRVFTGYAYNFARGRSYQGYGNDLWHPGFGWAFSRAAYDQMRGFFELELSGLGDGIMAHCIKGGFDWGSYGMGFSSDGHYQAIVQYNASCEGLNMGYVPGVLRHYFHGTYKDRRYAERRQMFDRHAFDPLTALHRDSDSGLISPTDNFPRRLKEELIANACV